jgi:hypothetical protein
VAAKTFVCRADTLWQLRGGYAMIPKDLLGCATARKGTCENRVNIRRDALEASVLNGLRRHFMDSALFKEFCDEFTREIKSNSYRSRRFAGSSPR